MKILASALFSLIIFVSDVEAIEWHEKINRDFFNVVSDLQQRAKLSDEQGVADLLEYPIVSIDWDSKLPGAMATHGRGEASIVVSVEMLKLLYFFAELTVVTGIAPSEDVEKMLKCKTEYSTHIRDQIAYVFEGGTPSGQFSTYDAPEEFATIGNHCRGVEDYFPLSDEQNNERNILAKNAIAFIVMHETGHVALGHRISVGTNEIRQSILCASRRVETEADEFSVKRLVRYGGADAVLNNSYWDLSLAVGTIWPANESRSTHPSPSRRMSESKSLSLSEARKLGASIDPKLEDLIQQLLDVQVRIEDELSDDNVRVQANSC